MKFPNIVLLLIAIILPTVQAEVLSCQVDPVHGLKPSLKKPFKDLALFLTSDFRGCIRRGYSKDFCLYTKGGFNSCLERGYDRFFCIYAENSFEACLDTGETPTKCLGASRSFKGCLDKFGSIPSTEQFEVSPFIDCYKVKDSFNHCNKLGYSPQVCADAPNDFTQCVLSGNHTNCFLSRGGFIDCTLGNYFPTESNTFDGENSCLYANENFLACISLGHEPEDCLIH